MAIGDDATAADIPLIPATADVRQGFNHHNETRDIIARRTNLVTPVAKGGTGGITATAARANLDVPSTGDVALRNGLGFPKGVAQLSAHEIGIYYNDAAQRFVIRKLAGGVTVDVPLAPDGAFVSKSGDTMTGHLLLPNATPATAGYVAAYINGDGRISKGASSERFKKFISRILPASLGNIWPDLHRFQMRTGDGTWKYGYIAERLAEHDDTRPFVVYDSEGLPESIDFIALLIAQNAQLHERVTALEAHVASN